MSSSDLNQPRLYINRDLSQLEFNQRVLEQARDVDTPLLERLRFLCISCTNLDEFFEVRVAGLLQKEESCSVESGPDNIRPHDLLDAIGLRVRALVDDQCAVLSEVLLPLLCDEHIQFFRREQWTELQTSWLHDYFREQLLPVLTPLGLDPANPFPRILNKSLNFIVSLEAEDVSHHPGKRLAIVQVPRAMLGIVRLPSFDAGTEALGHKSDSCHLVYLSSVIHAFVDELFHGMRVTGCFPFRVTRNSHLFFDEEEIDDLLRAVEGELTSRRYGDAVRLEISDQCPDELTNFLLRHLELGRRELYEIAGPLNLDRLTDLYDLVDRSDLKYAPFTPVVPRELNPGSDIFALLKKQDILLHHPFQSFLPVEDFVCTAAADPAVLSIKQTIYRVGESSKIIDALVRAARSGKEVTVVVELRARFDEEANIELANQLQEAGVHVAYGRTGYKTHAKMIHVVRSETEKLLQYVHVGTGNYHADTARQYTDYGLLTANKDICNDVHDIFLQLTSLCGDDRQRNVWHSPDVLHGSLLNMIQHEIDNAMQGKVARIIIKINALTEPKLIRALYRASMAGVKIDLIVRGACSLRPGIAGVSDNIRVCSVIGRFLEHTRVYCFASAGNTKIFAASADWMGRNLFQRVEICFPVLSVSLRKRMLYELELYLKDNRQSWVLQSEGSYSKTNNDNVSMLCAQAEITNHYKITAGASHAPGIAQSVKKLSEGKTESSVSNTELLLAR